MTTSVDPAIENERMTEVGDVIQVDPAHNPTFGGCFALVTERKAWGVQACVAVPENPHPASAYVRLPWSAFERIGAAVWVIPRDVAPFDPMTTDDIQLLVNNNLYLRGRIRGLEERLNLPAEERLPE